MSSGSSDYKSINESVSEKEGSKEDDIRLGNTTWCTYRYCKFYENMITESCRCCQEDAPLLGGKLWNTECVTKNADFPILCIGIRILICLTSRHSDKC